MTQPTTYLPHPQLQEYIASYGILEIPEGVHGPYFSPPLGLSGFIIQAINTQNKVVSKLEGEDFFTDNAVATGQVTYPVYGQLSGQVKTIMVFFQPLGMHQLFGTDMSSLKNKSMTLNDFLGKEKADKLLGTLRADQNNKRQIDVLNDFFIGLNTKGKEIDNIPKVLEFIHNNKGGVSIKEIEQNCHCHRKTLERHFKKMIGLSPKVYTQIYQFKCLINLLQAQPEVTWSQLADKAGYFDQSHMSRYVKEYLKVSPNSIVELDMDFINYLLRR
ncbi:AraC family transcriptional regulator [Arenibacter sp. F26102]|uniref:helix-turn-helix domain-containing protein n=1 Tax=Arenibacter sp. F26102 TaxID=2926416 RepID=UPI001FF30C59|nr:AraC family transcriptional regulator [Arenibacter sp. F26102]MCK0146237.1 AraC family transcriptional regulator [Arenibacter sp. F26102]